MHYTITARFKPETAAEFYWRLRDGTIENQKPDGKEIVASMRRAKIDHEGVVCWSEVCYCPTPLQHEKKTVYDHFFEDIETNEVENHVDFEGEDFMQHLARMTT